MSDQFDLTTQQEIVTEGTEREAQAGSRLPLPEVRTVDVRKDSKQTTFKKSLPREYFESAVVTLIMALF